MARKAAHVVLEACHFIGVTAVDLWGEDGSCCSSVARTLRVEPRSVQKQSLAAQGLSLKATGSAEKIA